MPRILIGYSACPLTRQAFEDAGCQAFTCDLLPARDGSVNHIQGDIWEVLHYPWDMAVLHPMCTYLTVSAAWAYSDPDYEKYPGVGYHQRDDASKATGLWLNGLPPLRLDPSKQVAPRYVNGKPRWANQTDSGQNRLSPSETRWLERSATYPGIAKAMGCQWGEYIKTANERRTP